MSWNKGLTKETDYRVLKISQTMKSKRVDNFWKWRDKMREIGKIPDGYPPFSKSEDLAEYIGAVLGDGNIGKFPRTERIIIVGNANNDGFIRRYANLTESLFKKKPALSHDNGVNAVRISLYQKKISKRLNVPVGNRTKLDIIIPSWIWKNNKYLISLLRGLFEAEGSLSIHIPTGTYNFQFKNQNKSLLRIVLRGLKLLGYHPEIRINSIRLRKKMEVESFRKLIRFRVY